MILISCSFCSPQHWCWILSTFSAMLKCKTYNDAAYSVSTKSSPILNHCIFTYLSTQMHFMATENQTHCPLLIRCVNFWNSRYFYNLYDYRMLVAMHNTLFTLHLHFVCVFCITVNSITNFPIHWNELNIIYSLNPEDFECDTIWLFIYTNWRDQIIIYSYSCPLFDANAVIHNSFKFRSGTLCIQSFLYASICKTFEFDPDFWFFSSFCSRFSRVCERIWMNSKEERNSFLDCI